MRAGIPILVGLFATAALTAACAEETRSPDEGTTDPSLESELRGSFVQLVGPITRGATVTVEYSLLSKYRALRFDAKPGEVIDIDAQSKDGDPVVFLTKDDYDVIKKDDGAGTSVKSVHLHYAVPLTAKAQSYRIVIRNFAFMPASFDVSLSIRPAPAACSHERKEHPHGATFAAADGCNTCTCADGKVTCSTKACPCDPSEEPHHRYVGDPLQCERMRIACEPGERFFQTACGCGCEPAAN